MNMSIGKRRFVSGALIALTATTLLACNRGGKEDQQPDPLGYYTAAEYSRYTSAISPSGYSDPTSVVIENAIRTGSPIAIRVLMDKLFAEHGQIYFGSRSYQTMPPRVAADKVWAALSEISGAIRYEGLQITLLKQKFERRVREFRRAQYNRDASRGDSFSIAAHLMENRGNFYSSSLAFDMFLRVHLGANYPSDRMVMVFTDGEMRIAELRNGNLFDFTDNGMGPESPMPVTGPIRVVRTDDFLFVEAMRAQVRDPQILIDGASDKMIGRFNFSVAMAGRCVGVPHLRGTIFGWASTPQLSPCQQVPMVHGHQPVVPRVIQPGVSPHGDPRMHQPDRRFGPQSGIGVLPAHPHAQTRGRPQPEGDIEVGPRSLAPGAPLHVPPAPEGDRE